MHTSQFRTTDPYDWFCGPGSHIYSYKVNGLGLHYKIKLLVVILLVVGRYRR